MSLKEIGKKGELLAEKFLIQKGINIIKKNYFTNYGEIDLIGIEKSTIIFTEVKLRNNNKFGSAVEAINNKKIKHLKKAAEFFLSQTDLYYKDCRFDIVYIMLNRDGLYKIEWIQNCIN